MYIDRKIVLILEAVIYAKAEHKPFMYKFSHSKTNTKAKINNRKIKINTQ